MLEHGGRLRRAAQEYGIPLGAWLDLSTGLNPEAWPVDPNMALGWARLPEEGDGLVEAAQAYYQATELLPVAGSQAAIQALPQLRPPGRVGIINPGYAEHAHAWARAGHTVTPLGARDIIQHPGTFDVLVLINPNNPTGERFSPDDLLHLHRRMAAHGGWLIVDEAFMDASPAESLAPFTGQPGLIVLRSLGKFFGLAGARVGFVLAETALLDQLAEHLGPWTLCGPSRAVACAALTDTPWQEAMRRRLPLASQRLATLLTRYGLAPDGGSTLFQWRQTAQAGRIHDCLARQGVLTRLFTTPASLRLGLPGDESQWQRLEMALSQWLKEAA